MNTRVQVPEHWNTPTLDTTRPASDASAYPTVFGDELAVNGDSYGLGYMHE